MKDIKIWNYKLNARNELSFKMTIKEWDYSLSENELIKSSETNWGTLDIDIIWLVNWDKTQDRKKKIQQLAMNMLTYAEKSNTNIDDLKKILYKKYNVKSRANLKIEDIEELIESYKMWIYEFSN